MKAESKLLPVVVSPSAEEASEPIEASVVALATWLWRVLAVELCSECKKININNCRTKGHVAPTTAVIEIHASLHKFEGRDQSGPYARPMIVIKRAATASAAATE